MRWLFAALCPSFAVTCQVADVVTINGKPVDKNAVIKPVHTAQPTRGSKPVEKILVLKSARQLQLISDGKPINGGDTFATLSGRTTTPYPKQKGEKYASQWLINNATEEARARGDNFNAHIFSATTAMKDGYLTTADRDGMLSYLFDQQPAVLPPITRPLTAPTITAPAPDAGVAVSGALYGLVAL